VTLAGGMRKIWILSLSYKASFVHIKEVEVDFKELTRFYKWPCTFVVVSEQ